MKVLVAGATSVLGRPVLQELDRRGHDPIGLTRSDRGRTLIAENSASALLADVFDFQATSRALAQSDPDAVISLLITLPKNGPTRVRHYNKTVRLWRSGVPNLIRAAEANGIRRLVAESVIFAYGYGQRGPEPITEEAETHGGAVLKGHDRVLNALRTMERQVLEARLEGIVLRYGLFHGHEVPTTRFMLNALRWHLPLVLGHGRGLLSWVEIEDAARATVDALERGRGGEIYNVVDDEPVPFFRYARELAAAHGMHRPRRLPAPLSRVLAPNAAVLFDRTGLPVSNAKAKSELGWQPLVRTPKQPWPGSRKIRAHSRHQSDRHR